MIIGVYVPHIRQAELFSGLGVECTIADCVNGGRGGHISLCQGGASLWPWDTFLPVISWKNCLRKILSFFACHVLLLSKVAKYLHYIDIHWQEVIACITSVFLCFLDNHWKSKSVLTLTGCIGWRFLAVDIVQGFWINLIKWVMDILEHSLNKNFQWKKVAW